MAPVTFGSAGSGTFGSGYSWPKREAGQLTANQALSLAAALNKEKRKSFLSTILGGGKSGVLFAMRQILRPSYGMAEGVRRGLEGEGFDIGDYFKGFSRGAQLKKHTTFADVLEQEGILEGHRRLRGVAGFGLDVLTDPTLLLIIGATGGAATPAVLAGKAALAGFAKQGATASAKYEAAKKSVKILAEEGENFTARKALANMESFRLAKEMKGLKMEPAELNKLEHLRTMAAEEATQGVTKRLQLQYALPFTKGKRVPLSPGLVKTPSLSRTAKGEGVVGKVPGVAKGALVLGKTFRHGFLEEEWAKPLLMQAHAGDRLFDRHYRVAAEILAPHRGLGEEGMRHALSAAEKNPHLIRGGARVLNEEQLSIMVERGVLNPKQAAFVRDWHKYWEYMRREDIAYGVKYDEPLKDKIYVPHIYQRDGGSIRMSDLAAPGYAKKRVTDLSLDEIEDMIQRGIPAAKGWITDPMVLAGIRTRRGAQAQTRETLLWGMKTAAGIPSRIPNLRRIEKVLAERGKHEARARKWEWIYDDKKIWSKRMNAIRRARIQHRKEVVAISKRYGELRSKTKPQYTQRAKEAIRVESRAVEKKYAEHAARIDTVHAAATLLRHADRGGMPLEAVTKSLENLGVSVQEARSFIDRVGKRDLDWNLNNPSDAVGTKTANRRIIKGEKARIEAEKQAALKTVRAKHPEKLVSQQLRLLRQADERLQKNVKKADDWLNEQKARGQREIEQAAAQIKRADDILARGPTVRNPNIPEGWQKLARKIGGENYHFSPELHHSMSRFESLARNEAAMEEFVHWYDKAMAAWKVGVTTINPGYRVRNTLSDFWNMYISGVPTWAMAKYAGHAVGMQKRAATAEKKIARAIARNEKVVLSKAERRDLEMVLEASNHGILSGLFKGDVQAVGRMLRHGGVIKDPLRRGNPLLAMVRVMQTMNRNAEDWGRLTHYLYRRRYEKLGAHESAAWVKKAHFDYSELTPIERDKFRRIMPFYTWTRKNIPYQLVQMVARPGKYATFPKMIQSSNYMATGSTETPLYQEGLLPEWAAERWAFRIPFFGDNAIMLPQIGAVDLAKLDNPREFVQMVAPPLRVPFEIASGRTLMGQDLRSQRRAPVSREAAAVFQFIPGADVGKTARTVRGQKVESPGAAQWVKYLAGQMPMANFFVNQRSPVSQERRGIGGNLGYLGGFPIFQRDYEQEQVIAQLEHEEQMKQFRRKLRDAGMMEESDRPEPTGFQKQLLKTLGGG